MGWNNNASRGVTTHGYYREGQALTPVSNVAQYPSVGIFSQCRAGVKDSRLVETGFPEYLT